MATITTIKGKTGISYRAQIRKFEGKNLVYSEAKTFPTATLAKKWASLREAQLTPGEIAKSKASVLTVGDLISKYEKDFCVSAGRTKKSDIQRLQKYDIAELPVEALTSEVLIAHVRERLLFAKPQTVNNDLIWLKGVFKAAYPAWGIRLDTTEIDAATNFCRSKGMIHKSESRDRRPTPAEIKLLTDYFSSRDGRSDIPMLDIFLFALTSSRRQSEITKLRWADNDDKHHTGLVRDIKHPRKKGLNKRFKYTQEAWDIVQRQPKGELIFPYNSKSIGAAFTRACHMLGIKDLHFHDLRREAVSRLFEQGYSIIEVVQFSLHTDWKILSRYTNLKPEDLELRG